MPNSQSEISNKQSADKGSQRTVLAIASAGGHWVQLLRLRPAFNGHRVIFATTQENYSTDVPDAEFHTIPDATRWSKLKLIRCAFSILFLILKIKPNTIITTGAAPGYFAIRIGSLLRIKTVWIDSIANAEELSLSGLRAKKCAHLWLTQWKHIARADGPHFFGNVLGEVREEVITDTRSEITNLQLPTLSHRNKIEAKNNYKSSHLEEPCKSGVITTENKSPITDSRSERELRIFVTVGSDVPFDRLLQAVDKWAGTTSLKPKIFAQIGNSNLVPKNFEYCKFLKPSEFTNQLEACHIVIAHTGMGSILSALRSRKSILTLPRHGSLGETRNDHQIATAKHLLALGIIDVAFDNAELIKKLNSLKTSLCNNQIPEWCSETLSNKLNEFIFE